MTRNKEKNLFEAKNISKRFGSVVALNDINFNIHSNEILGLVGDNGAGKSTLIKIISGNYYPDEGELFFENKKINLKTPSDARQLGIETIYQDLAICDNLSSVSNLFIGRELYRNIAGLRVLRKTEMNKKAQEVLNDVGINIPSVFENVEFLSGGQRQAVALGRFVAWGKKLILLDEPTAALGIRETRIVLELIKKTMEKRDVSIILISHNLQQIFEVVDRIMVLRHGKIIGIKEKKNTNPDEIVSMITGAIYVDKN